MNESTPNVSQFCESEDGGHGAYEGSTNSTVICPIQACPVDNYFEYVPESPVPCFCASPLRIGYRLKSPSFSYFSQYSYQFQMYLTSSLNLNVYQLSMGSCVWEEGPRLRMYIKLFPANSSVFNASEVRRIINFFTTWKFPGSDFFGPYEILNFTLIGPYTNSTHLTWFLLDPILIF